ncbi:MAG: 16S rRNA (cytidine(1402)-2'-O)-methyltransferase [Candidatus Gastranaerophilales bacterium]|nr:16S rRNA (cytidine(1402)-2'-O)-methyltransferase [Candidatus Gastranaerophilales bacterium]
MANSIENALYVVATPIGNLEDITLRAINVLKNVDVIAAEDTRNTSVLLEKYSISTKLISYHKYSENSRIELFLNYLNEGKSIALVSDAGTPLISDPGNVLVENVLNSNHKVIPISGASAVITLLSATSRTDEDFKFIGFLPKIKNQIEKIITNNKNENLIFYESPNRLIETMETIKEIYPDKKITVGRELTKKFEEIKTFNINEMIEHFKNNTLKGEIVVLLHKDAQKEEFDFTDKIKKLKKLNLKDKEISSILSELYDANKNAIYKKCLEINN